MVFVIFNTYTRQSAKHPNQSHMKILVSVKRVIDYNIRPRVKADHSGIETTNVKMAMNPFDEIAVEEALRFKEGGAATEVIAVSLGTAACQETILSALAMGSDRGILIESVGELEPLAVAKSLAALVLREHPGLVFLGKQAIDDDANQTGQMLAALLGWPQGTYASGLHMKGERIEVMREIDEGRETLSLRLPAVITTDLRLNQPRYATLPNIVKARKKPIERLSVSSLNVDPTPRIEILKVTEPERQRRQIMVSSVAELVDKLRNEAKVI